MAESERKTCVNNGCNFGRPSDGKFCSFCTKIGPATEQIRENTIKLYKKAQLHFLNRSISKYVIPNHHLFFINGSMENSYELFCFMRENYIFTAPPLTISLNLMDISMAKINDVMQNNYMHFRY